MGAFSTDHHFDSVQDSGERKQFSTGAQRDTNTGKGAWSLLPFYSLLRLAIHYENGAKKYGRHNWKKGMPLAQYLDAADRHLHKYMDGMRNEDHLAAVAWNVFAFLWTENAIREGKLPKELDDMGVTDLTLRGESIKCVPQHLRAEWTTASINPTE